MTVINRIKRIWYRINPKYKDRLFCRIFGKEKYKQYALDLYNAVNKSNYTLLSDLEIVTLENAVYLKMKNDVAYLVSGSIAMYEHQSSINPNMPVRGFMYLGELYNKILKKDKKRLYNNSLVKIPTPQYYVFYNGEKDYPETCKLRLSDAFMNPRDDNEFEFTATVININPGKNEALLESCEPLKGYSILVSLARTYGETMSPEEAVDKAVVECINNNILKDVLSEERAGVMLEMLTEFDQKLYEEGLREEGREEGIKQGREQERAKTEAERKRAESAEARAENAEARIKELEDQIAALQR